jgi:hypothetical protein
MLFSEISSKHRVSGYFVLFSRVYCTCLSEWKRCQVEISCQVGWWVYAATCCRERRRRIATRFASGSGYTLSSCDPSGCERVTGQCCSYLPLWSGDIGLPRILCRAIPATSICFYIRFRREVAFTQFGRTVGRSFEKGVDDSKSNPTAILPSRRPPDGSQLLK